MAIKNISSTATTIKDMMMLMPSDSWSIDKCTLFCNYDNKSIVQDELLLDKFQSYYEQFLIDVDLDEKYYYCPQLFAEDYYGDAALDFLVLYFAKMTSLFEFNKPRIKVFDYAHLGDLNKLFTAYKKQVDVNHEKPTEINSSNIGGIKTHAKFIKEK